MNSIITLLKKIESNPLLWLGKKDLERLRFFLSGYLTSEEDNGKIESTEFFESFKKYFDSIYGLRSYYGYDGILRQECTSEEEAFNKFFELFNQFLEEKK